MVLVACLILLDFLILWLLALTRRAYWAPVIALAVVVGTLNFFVVNAFNSGNGWPTPGLPDGQSLFLSCYPVSPSGNNPGAIYLVLVPPPQHPAIGYKSHTMSPRLFVEPFSVQLAQQCSAAAKKTQQGLPMLVKARKGKGKKGENGIRLPHIHFYKLPPSALPSKNH